jgi:hypothetical protein
MSLLTNAIVINANEAAQNDQRLRERLQLR